MAPIRGVRIAYAAHPSEFWDHFIRTLARDRFNRLNLRFDNPPDLKVLDRISQAAADHGIDFTLSLDTTPGNLDEILTRCRNIRSIFIQNRPTDSIPAIKAVGRFIALETIEPAAGLPVHARPIMITSPNGPLLWGDPDYLRRNPEMEAFEIELPPDYQRHWMAYLLWGRLAYDPKTSDKAWLVELDRRFGAAAPYVMEAYRNTTVTQTARNLAWGPRFYPFEASTEEAVSNRITGTASALLTPLAAAVRLYRLAANIEQSVARVKAVIDAENKEWPSMEADFLASATLAKFHAHMAMAGDQLEYFERTGADSALYAAQREMRGAVREFARIENQRLEPQPRTDVIDAMVKKYEQTEHKESVLQRWPPVLPRPSMEHVPPPVAIAGQPLQIDLKLTHRYKVILHFGPHDIAKEDKVLENETGHFTVPAVALGPNVDFVYYFEVLPNHGTGWFQPDPQMSSPYYTVKVQPAPPPKEDPGKPPAARVSK